MAALVDFGEDVILTAVRSVLTTLLPPDVDVIRGQVNRVPEPRGNNFVVMTPTMRTRLSTNIDSVTDTIVSGSVSKNVLIVDDIVDGVLRVGQMVFGGGLPLNAAIQAFGTGSGGVGTYSLNVSAEITSTVFYAGVKTAMAPSEYRLQLDFHGPLGDQNAQIASTMFRDEYACSLMPPDVQPLYADDPKQIPFINGERQYENRWTLDLMLQTNQTVIVPQQFADQLFAGLINVDVVYPP